MTASASLIKGWKRLSSRSGGNVAAIAATRAGGSGIVLAATEVGVFRSLDGGHGWSPAGDPLPFSEVVAGSPRFEQDGTLFAGTRGGLYRSRDAGLGWQLVLADCHVLSLTSFVTEEQETVVLVGTELDGVLVSRDGGGSWDGSNAGLQDLEVLAIGLSPVFAQDGIGFLATPSALYRTRNGGQSWRALTLPDDEAVIQCLALSPAFGSDRLVLAGSESDGLLRSDDGGRTWETVSGLAGLGVNGLAFSAAEPLAQRIVAATDAGPAVSTDSGRTWQLLAGDHGPALSVAWLGPAGGEDLLIGLAGEGIIRSTDLGQSWVRSDAGLAALLLTDLRLSPAFVKDRTIFTSGPRDGVTASTDGGIGWERRDQTLVDELVYGLAIAPGPTLFAATDSGVFRGAEGGRSWEQILGAGPANLVAYAPANPTSGVGLGLLFAAQGGRLSLSRDLGNSWETVEPDSGDAVVVAIAASPEWSDGQPIFAGTVGPSAEAGTTLLTVWRLGLSDGSSERMITLPGRPPLALAVVSGTDSQPGVLLVGAGGSVWSAEVRPTISRLPPVWLESRLPVAGAVVTALAGPADQTIFAASSAGIFRSRDGGATFSDWSDGLAPRGVVGIALSPSFAADRLVYVLGVGGAIWQRRDQPPA